MGGRYDPKHAPEKLFFGTGKFVAVSTELRTSLAYQSLSHTSRLVLMDMLFAYGRVSRGDTMRLDAGFRYSFSMCNEKISRATFYRSIKELKSHGFFEEPLRLQSQVPGGPSVYAPSKDWRKFGETAEGQAAERELQKFKTAKGRTITKENSKRAKYYETPKSESRSHGEHRV